MILEWLRHPWAWCVSGPLIGLFIPVSLVFGNKQLGLTVARRQGERSAVHAERTRRCTKLPAAFGRTFWTNGYLNGYLASAEPNEKGVRDPFPARARARRSARTPIAHRVRGLSIHRAEVFVQPLERRGHHHRARQEMTALEENVLLRITRRS